MASIRCHELIGLDIDKYDIYRDETVSGLSKVHRMCFFESKTCIQSSTQSQPDKVLCHDGYGDFTS